MTDEQGRNLFTAFEFLEDLAYEGKPRTGKEAILAHELGEQLYQTWWSTPIISHQ